MDPRRAVHCPRDPSWFVPAHPPSELEVAHVSQDWGGVEGDVGGEGGDGGRLGGGGVGGDEAVDPLDNPAPNFDWAEVGIGGGVLCDSVMVLVVLLCDECYGH